MRKVFLKLPATLLVGSLLTLFLSPVSAEVQAECPITFFEDFEPGPAPEWTTETTANLNPNSPNWALTEDPQAHSATHSFMSDASGLDLKDDRLTTPPLDFSEGTKLTFWHRFSFEPGFDGGILEVTRFGDNDWVSLFGWGGQFVEGGYNGTIDGDSGSPIAGHPAWTGDSPNPGAMTRVVVELRDPVNSGPYRLRWRLVLDPQAERSTPGGQWWIDDVEFTNIGPDCPPEPSDDFGITGVGIPVTVPVLSNDRDPDGEPIAVVEVTEPEHGVASINDYETVTYWPNPAFEGQDSFSYRVCEYFGSLCAMGRVFLTVGGQPQILPDPRCSEPGLTVLTDDTDDALTMQSSHDIERVSIVEMPQLGAGNIAFTLKVASLPTDPPASTTWAIRFRDPSGQDRFVRFRTDQNGSPAFSSGVGTDPAGSGPGTPADAASSFGTDGTIRIVVKRSAIGNPQPGQNLVLFLATVQFRAATVNLPADSAPNDQVPAESYAVIGSENCLLNVSPYAVDDSATAITGFPTRIPVLTNDADADGDSLATTGVTDPPNGTASINADNTVTYRSTCGFGGFDTFTYTVSDRQGGTDTALVTVQVRKTSRRGSIC